MPCALADMSRAGIHSAGFILLLLGSPLFLLLEKQEAGLHQVELHSLQPVVHEAAFFLGKKLIHPCYGQLQCRYQLFHMSSISGFFRGDAWQCQIRAASSASA